MDSNLMEWIELLSIVLNGIFAIILLVAGALFKQREDKRNSESEKDKRDWEEKIAKINAERTEDNREWKEKFSQAEHERDKERKELEARIRDNEADNSRFEALLELVKNMAENASERDKLYEARDRRYIEAMDKLTSAISEMSAKSETSFGANTAVLRELKQQRDDDAELIAAIRQQTDRIEAKTYTMTDLSDTILSKLITQLNEMADRTLESFKLVVSKSTFEQNESIAKKYDAILRELQSISEGLKHIQTIQTVKEVENA